jgi:hypothetical protein
MVDTSKFNLDTPIKISIMTPGFYIPELETYTPLKSYASIEKVITIMNRGIKIDFPQQEKNEISEKIEDFLLEYEEKKRALKKKYGEVGSNVDKALEVVQEINNSKITVDEEREEKENHIFDYSDIAQRISRNLREGVDNRMMEMISSSDDRIAEAEKIRKSKERVAAIKKEALAMASLETDALCNLAQNGKFDLKDSELDMDYDDPSTKMVSRKNR